MTTNEMAEKLAMEAVQAVINAQRSRTIPTYDYRNAILSTIPIREMLDAIEVLRESAKGCMHPPDFYCPLHQVINALDAKLGKV